MDTQFMTLSDAGRLEAITSRSNVWRTNVDGVGGPHEIESIFSADMPTYPDATSAVSTATTTTTPVPVTATSASGNSVDALSTPTIHELSICDSTPQISQYCSIAANQGLATLASAAATMPVDVSAISGNAYPTVDSTTEADVLSSLMKSQLDATGYNPGSFQCASPCSFQTLSVSQLPSWFDTYSSPGVSMTMTATATATATAVARRESVSKKRRSSTSSNVAASGRDSQPKFRKTENQLAVLVKYFSINRLPDREAVEKLAEVTGLTISEVKNWFRNRRLRYKDTKELSKRKQPLYNGPLTPSQHALLESMSQTASETMSNPYGKYNERKTFNPRPMLLQSEPQHCHATSDGPPTRRSERLRYKQEAKASLESALFRFVSKENGHVDVMATAAAGAGACGGGGSEIPFSSSAVDAFLEESDFPSILITPSETKEDCLFGDVSGDISHSFSLPPPPPPPPPGSSHLSPPLSSSSDMTPPTTPSLGFFSPSSSDAHPGAAIFANHPSPFDSAFDDVSEDTFGEVKESLHGLFTAYLPDSNDRKELLKTLLRDLNVREKTAVQQLVYSRSDDRYEVTPQNQAKEAWKELEERFSIAKVTHSATTEAAGRGSGVDTPPRSNHSDDSSNEGSPSSPLDPNMVEGLKCMFQSHRDYLHAVAKKLGVGSVVMMKQEDQ